MGRKQIVGKKKHANPNPLNGPALAQGGISSSRAQVHGQDRLPMDLGKQENDFDRMATPLRTWTDIPVERRKVVEAEQKATYGVTMASAIHNHGALIDQALREGPEGQRFYAGRAQDTTGQTGRDALVQRSREHDTPFHVLAAVRGVLSPRSNVHDELTNLDTAVRHMKANPDHEGPIPGIGGLAGTRNSTNAAAILKAHHQGIHPLDAERPAGASGKMRKVIDSPKVASYIQGYTHPDTARPTIDTHAVAGMAPHLPKSAPRQETGKSDRNGKPFLQPVSRGHADWVPNQEDALNPSGSYEFYAHAAEQAAHRRGLTGPEAQSIAWHVERVRGGNVQPGTGNAKSRVKGPVQGQLFNDRRTK